MSDREERLLYWQNKLGLQEWCIRLECDCTMDEVHGNAGEVEFSEPIKSAVIRILAEKYYAERILPFSFEKTLVHELLHLKLSLLQESGNDVQDRLVHQLIDDLARAFTGMDRGGAANE